MKRKWISDSSDSSTSSSEAYDAFLNFRGSDIRHTFVDCLYESLTAAGIHVFMDDESLHVGENIGDELMMAIESSKLYVPIFSRNYASSKWCLLELAHMVNCARKLNDKEILPVFLDVEPEDVKLKTELYTKDLLYHEECYGQDTVRNWREALQEVSQKKGWNWQTNQGQGKLIKQIAEDISRRLQRQHRNLPDHFIGNEKQVQEIMDKLDCGSRDVRIVVIHGMGGIGKTTLANAVFNKICGQFHGCSFLSNVRESAKAKGIVELQNKLLQDILRYPSSFHDSNDAMSCIRSRLRNMNVLIVLDDVSDMDQIRKLLGMGDWVGQSSRVIITTRNLSCITHANEIEDNLVILGANSKKIYVHQMEELDIDNSMQVLCRHAFGKDAPPSGYAQLSNDILSLTRGIPLAIEVIGSYLRRKDAAIWKEMFQKLKKLPHERLYREILMSSYETLCDEEKEIFLDIALLLAGHDKTIAFYYWEACGLFPRISVDILISYSLIKIDYLDTFWMHDLLRDLGREVVRRQSDEHLGKYSRLCNEDAKHLLSKKEGSKYVKALKLESKYSHNFTPAELSGLINLRFLELHGGSFVGEFDDGCLSELRWFSWKYCSSDFRINNSCFKNLVVLKLSNSNITDSWTGWKHLKTARSLKSLELLYLNLTSTPDVSAFLSLERLVVRQYQGLVLVDPSIGSPRCLNTLEFSNRIAHPGDVVHLPSSIGNLKALSRLVIYGLNLKQLPEAIRELKSLTELKIGQCQWLENLPDSIGDLESLRQLSIVSTGITELPESIGKLRNLIVLNVDQNQLKGLPATLGLLEGLEKLSFSYNQDIKGKIPFELQKLSSLRVLDLSRTGIWGLPVGIIRLSRLVSLAMYDCDEIEFVPDLPKSLTYLGISPGSLKAVPDLSSLTNLESLILSNRRGLENPLVNPPVLTDNRIDWIQHLPKLWNLWLDISPMPHYLSTGFNLMSQISHLDLSYPDPSVVCLPSGLVSLTLYHSTSLSRWEFLSNLPGLSELQLCCSVATEIWLDGLELLKNLTDLEISDCKFLERVHGISRLQQLKKFELRCLPKLVEIEGLSQHPDSLKLLRIRYCNMIGCLSAPESPSQLSLSIWKCSMLQDYEGPYDGYFEELERKMELDLNESPSVPMELDLRLCLGYHGPYDEYINMVNEVEELERKMELDLNESPSVPMELDLRLCL